MNVLIIGKNKINAQIEEHLSQEGFQYCVVEDGSNIKYLVGEAGDFCLHTANGELRAQYIVLTEEPKQRGEAAALPMCSETMTKLSTADFKLPIIFLMDYLEESSENDAITALTSAIELAEKKLRVVYMSKFVRTAAEDGEMLYERARNAGVLFIKYEDCTASLHPTTGVFGINVTDGCFNMAYHTPYVVSPVTEQNPLFLSLIKKLRIKTYSNNKGDILINRDRYFLNPVLTGRKGIFYLSEMKNESISCLMEVLKEKPEKIENYAVVDKNKCAFCYTCYRTCPHSAMEPDEEGSAMISRNLACSGCGICYAVCPADAIRLKDALEQQDLDREAELKMYCCENSAQEALKQIMQSEELVLKINAESVPCGGNISAEILTADLKRYKKVLVAFCMEQSCRHFKGSERACSTIKKLREQLAKAGIDENRLQMVQVSHTMTEVLKEKLLI